jgi:hypothetical protein
MLVLLIATLTAATPQERAPALGLTGGGAAPSWIDAPLRVTATVGLTSVIAGAVMLILLDPRIGVTEQLKPWAISAFAAGAALVLGSFVLLALPHQPGG